MRLKSVMISLFLCGLTMSIQAQSTGHSPSTDRESPSRLLVVWTTGDREVALKTVLLYTVNAKKMKWFDDVTLLVWGPSARLLAHDAELQEQIGKCREIGINLTACKACSDSYGVSKTLGGLGVTVQYIGQPLSRMLKAGWHVLTF